MAAWIGSATAHRANRRFCQRESPAVAEECPQHLALGGDQERSARPITTILLRRQRVAAGRADYYVAAASLENSYLFCRTVGGWSPGQRGQLRPFHRTRRGPAWPVSAVRAGRRLTCCNLDRSGNMQHLLHTSSKHTKQQQHSWVARSSLLTLTLPGWNSAYMSRFIIYRMAGRLLKKHFANVSVAHGEWVPGKARAG